MLFKTHLAFGFLCALFILPFFPGANTILYFTIFLFGSILPDIDHPKRKLGPISHILKFLFGHRGLFHSIFFAILLPGTIYILISQTYGIILFLGYLSHLFIDGFTKKGINYLHPISILKTQGFIETGTSSESILLITIITAIIIKTITIIF
jgi:inner membrane protein